MPFTLPEVGNGRLIFVGGEMALPIEPTVVGIAGPADIRNVAELHRELLQTLQRSNAIQLRLDSDADVDLAFVQLVEAVRRFAVASGKTVSVSAPAAAGLREILQRGGFLAAAGDRAFWLHQAGEC